MTKQAAIEDAQKYANLIGRIVYVLRRGGVYKTSQNECNGWMIAELVIPA